MRVRECAYSAGGFSPVVFWAVHVSVGNEIQQSGERQDFIRGGLEYSTPSHILPPPPPRSLEIVSEEIYKKI